jgi:plastocyanin
MPDSSTKTEDAYLPNRLEITVGDNVKWINGEDTVPRAYTVTSGNGVGDPNKGQLFDLLRRVEDPDGSAGNL